MEFLSYNFLTLCYQNRTDYQVSTMLARKCNLHSAKQISLIGVWLRMPNAG